MEMADLYLVLKRDTEAENHQGVEKQVLQACSEFMFESEASVVVWEVEWHVVFLIFVGQVWQQCFVFCGGLQFEWQEDLQG